MTDDNGSGLIESGNRSQPQNEAKNLLGKFVSSVKLLVDDITALEVNTMVVDKISASKFNAWDAYQEIYSIHDTEYFEVKGIPDPKKAVDEQQEEAATNLRKRYESLFDQLEKEYFHILLDLPNWTKYQKKIDRYYINIKHKKNQKDKKNEKMIESDPKYRKLARPILPAPSPVVDKVVDEKYLKEDEYQKTWEEIQQVVDKVEDENQETLEEQREEIQQVIDEKHLKEDEYQETWKERREEIQQMLGNDKFVRTLRKMSELKAALDGGNIHSTEIDVIYAQTVMQLDGDIINRYHKDLFQLSPEAKDIILKAHTEGVVAGEKQWRGTLNFLIGLVQSIANNLNSNERL